MKRVCSGAVSGTLTSPLSFNFGSKWTEDVDLASFSSWLELLEGDEILDGDAVPLFLRAGVKLVGDGEADLRDCT